MESSNFNNSTNIKDNNRRINKSLRIKLNNKTSKDKSAVLRYIKDAEEIYVKVLLFLFCCCDAGLNGVKVENKGDFNAEIGINCLTEHISDKNKTDEKKIFEALDFWKGKQILDYICKDRDEDLFNGEIDTGSYFVPIAASEAKTADAKPKNQSLMQPIDRISETLETKNDFRQLIQEAQQKFRSMFNPNDLNIMFNLYEINKIDIGLLRRLIDMCVLDDKANVKYLEKIALGLSSNGISTAEDYENNYNETFKVKEYERLVAKVFKMENRKFTSTEKSYIKKWSLEFDFSEEILRESYNICIERLKELKFGYINGILANWHSKGFTTLENIRAEFKKNEGSEDIGARASSFNIEQFFAKAVQKAMTSDD